MNLRHIGPKFVKSCGLLDRLFSDASLGNLPDGGTQGGHFIMIWGEMEDFHHCLGSLKGFDVR